MKLETIIEEVVSIPPAPQILPKLQAILRHPESDLEDIINLLKVDISITTEILKLANSMYFGFTNPVTSLEQAIGLMGFREIYKIVAVAAADTAMKEALPFYNANEGEFLDHSVATALIMTSIAEVGGLTETESHYTTGLLHGIGKIVINQYFLSRGLSVYGANHPNGEGEQEISLEQERQLFGFDHTEAGAALLSKWNFSTEIVAPIRHQYKPDKAGVNSCVSEDLRISRENSQLLIDGVENIDEWKLPEGEAAVPFSRSEFEEIISISHKKYSNFNDLLKSEKSSSSEHMVC
ncbi:MAG: HDOD domain-containing protein [Puniceicoccaceae bacterium]